MILPPSLFSEAYSTLTLGWKVLEERLRPFPNELSKLLQQNLLKKLGSEAIFKHELYRRAKPQDLLRSVKIRKKILEGLELAYNKGWLHFSSVLQLKNALKKYSSI